MRRGATELGEAVRVARGELGLDQRQVALIANVSPRTVHAVEHGKPTMRLDVLLRILEAVGLRLTTEVRTRVWDPRPRRSA
ncbi:MAG: helix-turn-helix transcriptional regulator [Solirubrobacterales bacterium]|nr:helix-turn-helix transcriptional regulator [Solirubrobacterales bacterium]